MTLMKGYVLFSAVASVVLVVALAVVALALDAKDSADSAVTRPATVSATSSGSALSTDEVLEQSVTAPTAIGQSVEVKTQ